MNIPGGHQTLIPYLVIEKALKFSEFVKEVFDAEETMMNLDDDSKTVSHAEIVVPVSNQEYGRSGRSLPSMANLFK